MGRHDICFIFHFYFSFLIVVVVVVVVVVVFFVVVFFYYFIYFVLNCFTYMGRHDACSDRLDGDDG